MGCGVANHADGSAKVVVAGGYDENDDDYGTVGIYDLATDTWTNGVPLRYARCDMASLPHGDAFLLIGGGNSSEIVDEILAFDPAEERFNILDGVSLKYKRHGAVAMYVDQSDFPECE